MPVKAGDVLRGRYEITGTMDSGTLADIRTARDLKLDRPVTVKLVTGEVDHQAKFYGPGVFLQEAKLASSLQHPHLLPVLDFGEQKGIEYLVMRWYNCSLGEYIRAMEGGPGMPLDETVTLFRRLAGAVDYMHEKGPIVHGNLKPKTVVLDTESSLETYPFISDFGVAALGLEGVGTPAYAAPEQFTEEINPSADVFALGTMLFECLTGELPVQAANVVNLISLKMNPREGQYSARRIRPDLPLAVDVVLDRMTRPDPAERYPTATAALDELTRMFYRGSAEVGGTVFISHARADQEYVQELAERLLGVGIPVWTDQEIPGGANWDECVEDALQKATKMLVILSPAALASVNVRDEWSYFLGVGKAVYPFVKENCELPFRLRRRQYAKSSGDPLEDVVRIVDILAER